MQIMARVEIHKADRDTYDRLHCAMEAESYIRTLTAEGTGEKSHMPTGTYWTEAWTDRWAAIEAAKRAALPIDPCAEITVCGEGRIVYYNCPKVVEVGPLASMFGAYSVPNLRPTDEFDFLATMLGKPPSK
jgi:hypothetical protein